MRKLLSVAILAIGILQGCQSPPASTARAWEYKLVILTHDGNDTGAEAMTRQLNTLGAEGWEYVSYLQPYTLFRRPLR